MLISDVRTHVLVDREVDLTAANSAQDDLIVEIVTDDGLVGVGETDMNPWIGRACIEAPGTHNMGLGLREMLIGQDPSDIPALWRRLYEGSAHNGRRGAMMHALGAIDIALHDLRGKALGVPCYELLGGRRAAPVIPYASLQPEVGSFAEYRDSLADWAARAVAMGFRAVKAEVTFDGPFAHRGLREPWERSTEVIEAVRAAIGPDVALLVDVQYAFSGVEQALRVLAEWERLDPWFVEAPLWADDLDAYARLSSEQPIPIASGEWLSSSHEFRELAERGLVQVLQPDVGRVGGFTEAVRVCELAAGRGLAVVPHVWKTAVSIAAAAHLAAARQELRFIEFLPAELCESGLRRDVAGSDLDLVDGVLEIPDRPGLGVDVDPAALERYGAS